MPYKTIHISLNDIETNHQVIESAAQLTRVFGAHLTGLYVIPAAEVYGTGFDVMPVINEVRRNYFRNATEAVRKQFGNIDLPNDFRLLDGPGPDIAGQTISEGRTADIVILSQADRSDKAMLESDFVERILMSTGRPGIVLPRTGKMIIVPDLAVVGWNGRREAARAVFDSLPLLKRAKKVLVVWANPDKDDLSPGSVPGMEIAEALSRHDINVAVEPIVTGGRGAGEALLTKVADSGADLLVMGAYGHSRLTELILGGATRTVLEDMRCPVFFSH